MVKRIGESRKFQRELGQNHPSPHRGRNLLAHWKWVLVIGLGVMGMSFSGAKQAEAQSFWGFGRSLSEVSAPDRDAMKRARIDLLQKLQAGAMSTWKDEKTGHLGEVSLRRVYEQNGKPCADVEYVLKSPEVQHYLVPFCQGADGTWRAAF